jgi:hypothetical protein
VTRQAGYESHEYDRLKERKFRPYSRGHQVMYLQAIAELKRDFAPGSVRVLEAGFGIGWGLGEMLKAGILKSYVPYEPNLAPDFDAAFCIEVIEHVPMDQHVDFLRGLHRQSPLLFLSTPDKDKKPTEGVRTKDDWVMRLIEAGFSKVDVMTKEWTYLYRCTR